MNGVHARNSVIGLRSRIESGVRIEKSILMGSDYFESIDELRNNLDGYYPNIGIGRNTIIRRAIIDKNVRIGKDVKLVNLHGVDNEDCPNGSYYIREGIVIVPKGALIKDGTEI
jgi:glucose-1-phosphate adenylyltransferase